MSYVDSRPAEPPTTGDRRPPGYPPSGPTERVPVPMRRRRPGLAALAIVLVLGGASLSAFLVLNSGHKQSAIIVRHEMRPGDPFTRADIEEGQVAAISPSGALAPLPWTEAGALVARGFHAKYALPVGSILTGSMVTTAPLPGTDCASAPIHLTAGQYPAEGVQRGDIVRLLYVPPAPAPLPGASVPTAPPAAAPVLVDQAYVSASRPDSAQDSLTVSVVLPANDLARLGQVATAAGAKSIYVLRLNGRIAENTDLQQCH